MDLSQIFSLSFWFDLHSTGLSSAYERGFFFLFAMFIILGSVSRMLAKNKKDDRFMVKAYRNIGQMFNIMGVLGLFWFFFAYEQIYFFGARFWFIVWSLCLIAWITWIVWYVKVKIPELKDKGAVKKEVNKYIPRKRSKK